MVNHLRIIVLAFLLIAAAAASNTVHAAGATWEDYIADGNKIFVQGTQQGTTYVNVYSTTPPANGSSINTMQVGGQTYYYLGWAGNVRNNTNGQGGAGMDKEVLFSNGTIIPQEFRNGVFQFNSQLINSNGILTSYNRYASGGGGFVGVAPSMPYGGTTYTTSNNTPTVVTIGPNGVVSQTGQTTSSGQYNNLATGGTTPTSGTTENTDIEFGCGILSGWNGLSRCVVAMVYYIIVLPVHYIFGLITDIYDWVLKKSLEYTNYEGKSATTDAIRIGWLAIRDILNITFIFALLWYAIGLIIGSKRDNQHLVNIILAAIFINFSWFIVSELVKISNAASMAIYNSISGGGESIASGFSSALGLGNLVSPKGIIEITNSSPANAILLMLFGVALMVILGVILLFTATLFVARYVIITILVVVSPAMFLGFIFPAYASQVKKDFWSSLQGQLIFPVAYFAMLWVSFNIVSAATAAITQTQWVDLLQLSPKAALGKFSDNLLSLLWLFAITVAFLVGSIVVAKKFAFQGNEWVGKIQDRTRKIVGGITFGAPATIGRRVIGGALGSRVSDAGLKMAGSSNGMTRALGRLTMAGGDKLQRSTFDLRQSGAAAAIAGKPLGAGEGSGKTYQQTEEDRMKKYAAERARLAQLNEKEKQAIESAQASHKAREKTLETEFKDHNHGRSVEDVERRMKGLAAQQSKAGDEVKAATEAHKQVVTQAKTMMEPIKVQKKAAQQNLTALQKRLNTLNKDIASGRLAGAALATAQAQAVAVGTQVTDRTNLISSIDAQLQAHEDTIARSQSRVDGIKKRQDRIKTVTNRYRARLSEHRHKVAESLHTMGNEVKEAQSGAKDRTRQFETDLGHTGFRDPFTRFDFAPTRSRREALRRMRDSGK